MIHFLEFNIPLPPFLAPLDNPLGSMFITLAIWAVIAVLVEFVLVRLVRRLARLTETDVDDVVLHIVRMPLILALMVCGLRDALPAWGLDTNAGLLGTGFAVFFILLGAYVAWQLVKEVLLYYADIYAERTETAIDDILVPAAKQLVPILVVIVTTGLILQAMGIDVSLIVAAVGGISFITAFALQDTLSNLFAGLSLVIDTPFQQEDLIILEDGTICEVQKVGLRVTRLYNAQTHAIIFMPNTALANEKLVNITKPSHDLKVSVSVRVGYEVRADQAGQVLETVTNANPYVLGSVPRKLAAMRGRLATLRGRGEEADTDEVRSLEWGLVALSREQQLDETLDEVDDLLRGLAGRIAEMEQGGLDDAERAAVRQAFAPLGGDMMEALAQGKRRRGKVTEAECAAPLGELSERLLEHMRAWAEARTRDPHLSEYARERQRLLKEADRAVQRYRERVCDLRRRVAQPSAREERRLDDRLRDFVDWIADNFKQRTPDWKYVSVDFDDFGPPGIGLQMSFFVDDVHLEHFERLSRVLSEVRHGIMEQFEARGWEVPVPPQTVRFFEAQGEVRLPDQGDPGM